MGEVNDWDLIPEHTGLEQIDIEQYWEDNYIQPSVRAYMLKLIANSRDTLRVLGLPFASGSFIS